MYLRTEIAALSNLRALYMSLNEGRGHVCRVYLDVKWELMHALQHATFKGRVGSFCFWTTTLDLVHAPNLNRCLFATGT